MNYKLLGKSLLKTVLLSSLALGLVGCGDDDNGGGGSTNQLEFTNPYSGFNQQNLSNRTQALYRYEQRLQQAGLQFYNPNGSWNNNLFNFNAGFQSSWYNGRRCYWRPIQPVNPTITNINPQISGINNTGFLFSLQQNKTLVMEYYNYLRGQLVNSPNITRQINFPYINNGANYSDYTIQEARYRQSLIDQRNAQNWYMQILAKTCSLENLMTQWNALIRQQSPNVANFYTFQPYQGTAGKPGCNTATQGGLIRTFNAGAAPGTRGYSDLFMDDYYLRADGSVFFGTQGNTRYSGGAVVF